MLRVAGTCGESCPSCMGDVHPQSQSAMDLSWGVLTADAQPGLPRYWKAMLASSVYRDGPHQAGAEPSLDRWVATTQASATLFGGELGARFVLPPGFEQPAGAVRVPDMDGLGQARAEEDEPPVRPDGGDPSGDDEEHPEEEPPTPERPEPEGGWDLPEPEPEGMPYQGPGGEWPGPEEGGLARLPVERYRRPRRPFTDDPVPTGPPRVPVLGGGRKPRCCVKSFQYPRRWRPFKGYGVTETRDPRVFVGVKFWASAEYIERKASEASPDGFVCKCACCEFAQYSRGSIETTRGGESVALELLEAWREDCSAGAFLTGNEGAPPPGVPLECFGDQDYWITTGGVSGATYKNELKNDGCKFEMVDTPGAFADQTGSFRFAWTSFHMGEIVDICRNMMVLRRKALVIRWEGMIVDGEPVDFEPSVSRLGADYSIGAINTDGTETP